jgi:hypothetical protein
MLTPMDYLVNRWKCGFVKSALVRYLKVYEQYVVIYLVFV